MTPTCLYWQQKRVQKIDFISLIPELVGLVEKASSDSSLHFNLYVLVGSFSMIGTFQDRISW